MVLLLFEIEFQDIFLLRNNFFTEMHDATALPLLVQYKAKNHSSPGEPYFAIIYHNNFQRAVVNFAIFKLLGKNVFEVNWHKIKIFVSMKSKGNTGN